jgi:hypothetical protein
MGTQTQLSNAELEEAAPVVSYLGPVSSYTHQVYHLVHFDHFDRPLMVHWTDRLGPCSGGTRML